MPRSTTLCPQCHRELYHLHTPHCSWCGAALPEEQFAQVALLPGGMLVTGLPPLLPNSRLGGNPEPFSQNPFSLVQRPASPWKRNLKIIGTVFLICLVLADVIYGTWRHTKGTRRTRPCHHCIKRGKCCPAAAHTNQAGRRQAAPCKLHLSAGRRH